MIEVVMYLMNLKPQTRAKIEGSNMISTNKILRKIVNKTLCCGYSLETSQRDNSNEYPQHSGLEEI